MAHLILHGACYMFAKCFDYINRVSFLYEGFIMSVQATPAHGVRHMILRMF